MVGAGMALVVIDEETVLDVGDWDFKAMESGMRAGPRWGSTMEAAAG